MPSKQRGEELRKIIKSIRDGTFKYESKEPVTTNWTQYDHAQIHEMADYLDNIRDLVEEADRRIKERTPPGKRGPGRPPTDPADVAKALLLQTYADASNRATEGLLLLFREKLSISRHFSYMLNIVWIFPICFNPAQDKDRGCHVLWCYWRLCQGTLCIQLES